jgi:hypothetical protein
MKRQASNVTNDVWRLTDDPPQKLGEHPLKTPFDSTWLLVYDNGIAPHPFTK